MKASATAAAAIVVSLLAATPAPARPGDVDASFSDDGKTPLDDRTQELVPMSDGGIVLLEDGGRAMALTGSGAPRRDFGDSGVLRLSVEEPDGLVTGYIYAVAAQPDGKLIVGGQVTASDGSGSDAVLARYTSDGRLDPGFGSAGTVRLDIAPDAGHESVTELALSVDGHVTAAVATETGAVLARLDDHGALDPSFSQDGLVRSEPRGSNHNNASIAAGPAGSVYAAGAPFDPGHPHPLVRLLADGSLDPSFDASALNTLGLEPVEFRAAPPDRLVVLGRNDRGHSRLVRLNPDGSLDQGFDRAPLAGARPRIDPADFAIAPDGSIYALGAADDLVPRTGTLLDVIHVMPSGLLDPNFSGDGRAPVTLLGSPWLTPDAIGLAADGKVLVGGTGLFVPRYGDVVYEAPAIARLRIDPGPSDADSDGVEDDADRCMLGFGDAGHDGCVILRRQLTMEAVNRGFAGKVLCPSGDPSLSQIKGRPCAEASDVIVYRRQPGRDRRIGSDDGGFRWVLEAESLRPGTYYARIRAETLVESAIASGARSEPIRLR